MSEERLPSIQEDVLTGGRLTFAQNLFDTFWKSPSTKPSQSSDVPFLRPLQLLQENSDVRLSVIDSDDEEDEEHEDLVEWPGSQASYLAVAIHIILLPLKCLLWISIPDVRKRARRNWYMGAIFACVVWLALLSFVMSISVESLAHTVHISDTVAGLTISAAGTSFPNVFASMIVARQGLGNMAVSNAMGSNVFNIFMGLGLPWLLYCLFPPSNDGNEVSTVLLYCAPPRIASWALRRSFSSSHDEHVIVCHIFN